MTTFHRTSDRVDLEAEHALREWAFKDAAEEDRALEEYESLACGVSRASASVLCSHPTIDEMLGNAA